MEFSRRLDWELAPRELTVELDRKRDAGETVWDLTESNPTRAGLPYPSREILLSLADERALVHEPSPQGLPAAREAIAAYYAEHGARVAAEDVLLTASTSEAYGFLLKLLCEPGDRVLVPRPGYPLFDWLARLEGVEPLGYSLVYDGSGSWNVDVEALRATLRSRPGARAIFAVHPNNPTGSYVIEEDRRQLFAIASEARSALVVDEVFLDFPLPPASAAPSFAGTTVAPVFVVSGISKIAGLPQMKLSWIAAGGDAGTRRAAGIRLEHVADQYLSVAAPAQHALPRWLSATRELRGEIVRRVTENRDAALLLMRACPTATLLPVEAGWYAVMRLPATRSADAWARRALRERSVHVHPGELFGFSGGAFAVVSLLTRPTVFHEGLSRFLDLVASSPTE